MTAGDRPIRFDVLFCVAVVDAKSKYKHHFVSLCAIHYSNLVNFECFRACNFEWQPKNLIDFRFIYWILVF